ncbi:MAG: ADP-ribosyltransferase [Bacteroidales bacterium]|nr:ADP-ribosyltransferase [Bacteroidales bacterium]
MDKLFIVNFITCGLPTGTSKGTGFEDLVTIEIHAKKGTKCMYIEPFSEFGEGAKSSNWDGTLGQTEISGENETLIQRGTTFLVKDVEILTNGKYKLILEVVKQQITR